jgi:hypothetical protein
MENKVWTDFTLSPEDCLRWVSPEITVSLKKEGEELVVGKWPTVETDALGLMEDTASCPDDVEWSRFVLGKEQNFELSPLLPDRPIVLLPKVGRQLPPGRKGEFFFLVPVRAGLWAGTGDKRTKLMEFPCRSLTSTWFGDMLTGELCYGHSTRLFTAGTAYEAAEYSLFDAGIKLHLRNTSQNMLDFSRICVHVEHLSLYLDKDDDREPLLTNEVFVIFSGTDQVSQVRFGKRGPKGSSRGEAAMARIAPPRIEPEKSILKRSFSFLKSLAEI